MTGFFDEWDTLKTALEGATMESGTETSFLPKAEECLDGVA